MKEKVIKWYNMGLWTSEMVLNSVKKNILTEKEANELLKEE